MKRNGSILDLAVHPYGITLHLFNDRTRFRRAANSATAKRGALTADRMREVVGMCSTRHTTIFLGVFDGTVGTLVHELVHALDRVINHCSLPCVGVGENDEPAAYLMEFMFNECDVALKRAQKGRR